jgi:hypothetical protein
VSLVVANGMLPRRFSAAEARALDAAVDSPEVRAARHAHARSGAQRAQLARLRRGVRAPVATLPFVFDDDHLRRLARELERAL